MVRDRFRLNSRSLNRLRFQKLFLPIPPCPGSPMTAENDIVLHYERLRNSDSYGFLVRSFHSHLKTVLASNLNRFSRYPCQTCILRSYLCARESIYCLNWAGSVPMVSPVLPCIYATQANGSVTASKHCFSYKKAVRFCAVFSD